MEDVVAVEVTTDAGTCYFITWGRIQDPVDSERLEALVLLEARRFALPGTPVSAAVCRSLRDARDAPLFYEAIIEFAHKPIPFGDGYDAWRQQMAAEMDAGRELYFAGPSSSD